jgi:hypothetical protein
MFCRDALPLPPSLHGRMVAMPEGASERTDTAALLYEVCMIVHTRNVRTVRTFVKGVEYVPGICDHANMPNKRTTIGETLLALKARADFPLEEIARRAGYRGKSSVQEYFKAGYEGPLSGRIAGKLAEALEGAGTPPITRDEIAQLVDELPPVNGGGITRFEGASLDRMKNDWRLSP